ncbi:MAG: DUF1569 domain-containing protein [Anaerolineae bacterium]|nr:DUF1569 domain-containing protein [Gemmatimonadaceae bacterium]
MKTLFQANARDEVLRRFGQLTPQHQARWGSMNAPRMLKHIVEAMRMAVGDLYCKPKNTPLRRTPLKQLVIYWLPFPKGVPTSRELIQAEPGEWEADLAVLRQLIDRFAARESAAEWPVHPAFGSLTAKQWGILAYRHTDHHLRQFRV